MTMTTPLVRNTDAAERRWFYGGGLHTWLVGQAETGGDFLLFEDEVAPGKCTPLHTHPHAEETLHLLAGSMLLHVAGTETELRVGGVAVIPRDVPHAFLAQSDGARMLCLHTPGGGEEFYRTASDTARPGEPPPPVDFDQVKQAALATGSMRVVGPPPFHPANGGHRTARKESCDRSRGPGSRSKPYVISARHNAATRNPGMHTPPPADGGEEQLALEQLAGFSLLARRVDQADVEEA